MIVGAFVLPEVNDGITEASCSEMLAVENWDGLTELARELENEGSHVLDVCTAFVGRNESTDMRTLLQRFNRQITAPIMVDSTEAPVIEIALQTLAGKPIVNSINFEDGEGRTRRVLDLCRTYGAGVVALTIDESGMARTADRKLEVARRIVISAPVKTEQLSSPKIEAISVREDIIPDADTSQVVKFRLFPFAAVDTSLSEQRRIELFA